MRETRTEVEVSVIVPCRGQADSLGACLRSLQSQRIERRYEIVVVDSAADPAVAEVVAAFPDVRLVRSREGLAPGAARNLGVSQARGRYLAFTDADCRVEEDWLQAALEALGDGAWLVGGPVLDLHPFHPIAVVDNLMQFTDFAPGRPEGPVPHLPGCNVALLRSTYQQLGGFASPSPIGEDTVFSASAAESWPGGVRFSRRMRVRHEGRRQIAEFWRHQYGFGWHRGRSGLRLSRFQRRWGHSRMFAGLFAIRRSAYFFVHALRWYPARLPRLVLFSPVLALGLAAWSRGLSRGCREARPNAGDGLER